MNAARRPRQLVLVVEWCDSAYSVRFVHEAGIYFLKPIIPGRKVTRDDLRKTTCDDKPKGNPKTASRGDSASEKPLVAEYERGELRSSVRGPEDLGRSRRAARSTLARNSRLTIRLSSRSLEGLKVRAAAQGLPYQTRTASVLHTFLTDRLTEKP